MRDREIHGEARSEQRMLAYQLLGLLRLVI